LVGTLVCYFALLDTSFLFFLFSFCFFRHKVNMPALKQRR